MPGTGVPVVCAGSSIVADKVDRYLQSRRRPTGGKTRLAMQGATSLLTAAAALLAVLTLGMGILLALR